MTDDEWEADEKAILNALYDSRESFSGGGEEVGIDETAILVDHVPEIVLGLGFRRSGVPEPSATSIQPFHSKVIGMPELFLTHCSEHPDYGICAERDKAETDMAAHLASEHSVPQGEPSNARIRQAVLDGLAAASVLQSPLQPQTRELVVEQITLALRAAFTVGEVR